MRERARAGAAVLARARRLRREGGRVPAPRLAALGARQRAEPRVGHHVGRRDQDGRLRPRPLQRLAARARRGRLGGDRPRRGRRAARHRLRAGAERRQAPAGVLLGRERRRHPDRAGRRAARPRARRGALGASRARRRPAPRVEPRRVQGAAVLRRGLGAARHRDAGDEPARRPLAHDALDRRRCSRWARSPSPGLPPLNGFVSEWLVYLGLFDAVASREPPCMGGHAGRDRARDGRGARAGDLRQGGRDDVPRRAAHAEARSRPTSAARGCGGRCWRSPGRASRSGSRRSCSGRRCPAPSAPGIRRGRPRPAPAPLFTLGAVGLALVVARGRGGRSSCGGKSRANGLVRGLDLGLRLRGPDRPHAVHERLLRGHRRRLVRLGPPTRAPQPTPAGPLPGGGAPPRAHAGDRARAADRPGRRPRSCACRRRSAACSTAGCRPTSSTSWRDSWRWRRSSRREARRDARARRRPAPPVLAAARAPRSPASSTG